MRDMAVQGPYFSELLLNAIFFVASKHRSRIRGSCDATDTCDEGLHFRRKVEDILHHPGSQVLCKSSITTIQALILISDVLFSWCDEGSLSWHYLGIAINMINDLGIHSENSSLRARRLGLPEDLETSRRIFWAAFGNFFPLSQLYTVFVIDQSRTVLDKLHSIYQGRPARLLDMDSSVPIAFLDEYEELEAFDPVGYSAPPTGLGHPTYSISTFKHLCRLSTIAERILRSLYAEKSLDMDPQDLFRTSLSLNADLEDWRRSLPAHLLIHSPDSGSTVSKDYAALPHILSLTQVYRKDPFFLVPCR
jgi:hypothetical protein